jgi:glycosyltransferase involved in cell wall biosynthesis
VIKYSFIIPVYNRPDELDELLSSFPISQTHIFEIIVVEDGSDLRSDVVVGSHGRLPIQYIFQENAGPGPARNTGAAAAHGDWLIFLDSDTLLSNGYFAALEALDKNPADFFGGPDSNHSSFSAIQLAIGYSMTSFLSTGGIRGSKRSMEKFKPRSFNMGVRRKVFEQIGGFAALRFGEDMDLSLRLEKGGSRGVLLEDAIVYHKRRSSFRQFYKQVFNSGMARIVLTKLHPGSMKLVHLLPPLFVLYHVLLIGIACAFPIVWFVLLFYPSLYFMTSAVQTSSIKVAVLATCAVYVQLFGYGLGFMKAAWSRYILRSDISYAFRDSFYKG